VHGAAHQTVAFEVTECPLAMLVVGIDTLLAPTLTTRLVDRLGTGPVLLGGTLLAVAAYALFLPAAADWTYPAMLPSLVVLGLAFALAYGPLTMAATDGIEEREPRPGQWAALHLDPVRHRARAVCRDGGYVATLDGASEIGALRVALVVPIVAVGLGALIIAFGLRAPRTAPVAAQVSRSR
jgi:hypothetical protein